MRWRACEARARECASHGAARRMRAAELVRHFQRVESSAAACVTRVPVQQFSMPFVDGKRGDGAEAMRIDAWRYARSATQR